MNWVKCEYKHSNMNENELLNVKRKNKTALAGWTIITIFKTNITSVQAAKAALFIPELNIVHILNIRIEKVYYKIGINFIFFYKRKRKNQ